MSSKNQIIIPKGLSPAQLKQAIVAQQDKILHLFAPLLEEVDRAEKEFVTTDERQKQEFETSIAFCRNVPLQAVQIVYQWVRMDYVSNIANRSCARIQFRGTLYEVPVQFVDKYNKQIQ
jgi:hypothetical protein